MKTETVPLTHHAFLIQNPDPSFPVRELHNIVFSLVNRIIIKKYLLAYKVLRGCKMSYLVKLIQRKFGLIENDNIFLLFFTLLQFSLTIFFLFISFLSNGSFLIILVLYYSIFQYASPMISYELLNKDSFHYIYSKKVFLKYILFVFYKNNPLFISGLLSAIISLITGLFLNVSTNIHYITIIVIQIGIYLLRLPHLLVMKIMLIGSFVLLCLCIYFNLSIFVKILALVISIIIICYYIYNWNKMRYHINLKNTIYENSLNENKVIISMLIKYFDRFSLKKYIGVLVMIVLFIFVERMIPFLNANLIILGMLLFDLGFIYDKQHHNLEETSAIYYGYYHMPIKPRERYFISEQFKKVLSFSSFSLIFSILLKFSELNLTMVLECLATISLINLMGFEYFLLVKKIVIRRKKVNTRFLEYLLMTSITSIVIIPEFLTRKGISSHIFYMLIVCATFLIYLKEQRNV